MGNDLKSNPKKSSFELSRESIVNIESGFMAFVEILLNIVYE
jgi:hypothetical protein